jgi:proline dehydrogenase
MADLLLKLAKRWVAGASAEDAIERAKLSNSKGVLALLNLLGEHIEDREQITSVVKEYMSLIDAIKRNHVKAQVSVKPSQIGLKVDFDFCLQNCLALAEYCSGSNSGNRLWLDMESSAYTQTTIDLYSQVLEKFPDTGVCIQAYLKRSESDLKSLVSIGGNLRLVKSAYNESSTVAFKGKKDVRASYAKLLELLFSDPSRKNFFAVATHDSELIGLSRELRRRYNRADNFEYEMLMGVRDTLKSELVAQGLQIREYIPYGADWLPYSIRRLREKKSNIFLLMRSLFS